MSVKSFELWQSEGAIWFVGVSGHEILLAVAVFCFAWQRRMSLGQGGVEWGGAEESGFALCFLIYWSRLIDGRALYRGLAFPVGRTTSWRKNRKERNFHPFAMTWDGVRDGD